MSDWKYDAREYGEYEDKRRSSDDGWGGWGVIVFFFLIGAWPVGLALLLAKLADTPAPKKRAAQSKVTQAARKVTQTPRDTSGTAKTLQIVGGILAAVFGVMAFSQLGALLGGQGMNWGWLFQSAAVAVGGAAMFLSGRGMGRRRARIERYKAIMGARDWITLAELAAVSGRRTETVKRDAEYMLRRNLLGTGAFLDAGRGILFRSADAYQSYLRERSKKENLTPKEANEGYSGALRAIRAANDRIPDPVFSEKLDRMEALAGKIFKEVEAHPEKQKQASAFFDYYLPTTLKLLATYTEFEEAGVEGENLKQAKARIESITDNLLENFERQLDALYRSEAMDVDADIRVMENMLDRDLSSVERDFGLNGGAAAQEETQGGGA